MQNSTYITVNNLFYNHVLITTYHRESTVSERRREGELESINRGWNDEIYIYI